MKENRSLKCLDTNMFSANSIKMIAIFAMLIDHIAALFVPYASTLWIIMRMIGKITEPVMCFFIAEGYFHTSNLKKYMLRLLAFAVISHFPFVLCFGYDVFEKTSVMWGLLMGLIALSIWKIKKLNILLKLLGIAAAAFIAEFADWGFMNVLLVLAFGVFRDIKWLSMLAYVGASGVFYIYPVLNDIAADPSLLRPNLVRIGFFIPLIFFLLYSGELGKKSKFMKYGFYIFYPAHLLILFAVRMIVY